MSLGKKDWSLPSKQRTRQETILNQYYQHFGKSLPQEQQYWTLAGRCTTGDGEPLPGCEPDQLIRDGLITPEQYCGVDVDEEIHRANVQAYPGLRWVQGDLHWALNTAAAEGWFHPGIIHADLTWGVDRAASYIAGILRLLTQTVQPAMLVANVVLQRPYGKDGWQNLTQDPFTPLLYQQPQCQWVLRQGRWRLPEKYYLYRGTSTKTTRTCMGVYTFLKS